MKDDLEREQRFEALESTRAGLPEHDEAEVPSDAADAAEAVEAVEAVRRARRGETASPSRAGEGAAPEDGMGGEAPCQLHRFWDVED
jgi:hypothetical protein